MTVGGLRFEKVCAHNEKAAKKPPSTKVFKKGGLVLEAHGLALGMNTSLLGIGMKL